MTITITTDRNPEAWGAECDEITAQKAAAILAQMLADEALAQWPEAQVEFGTEYVVSGGSTRLVIVEGVDGDDGEAQEEIGGWLGYQSEQMWESALGKALG